MGIHTLIFRERYLCADDHGKYRIKLFKGTEENKLENPVSFREEFYFGKSTWAINEWFYRNAKEKNGKCLNSDFSFECIYDESIYIEELEKLLENIEKVLANPEKAGKILPMPKK